MYNEMSLDLTLSLLRNYSSGTILHHLGHIKQAVSEWVKGVQCCVWLFISPLTSVKSFTLTVTCDCIQSDVPNRPSGLHEFPF